MNQDAQKIIETCIRDAMPDVGVKEALKKITLPENGKLIVIAVGKAGWEMAHAAYEVLGNRIDGGAIITKYGHIKGEIPPLTAFEAGHPVPDANSYAATHRIMEMVEALGSEDIVLFLLSGGGSALFEYPLISDEEMASITQQLLACGADIVEMNTIRKRLSAVKGGRFAMMCSPAKVYSIVLSDIIGDPLDMIASGPAYPDTSTCESACEICERYALQLSPAAHNCLTQETPKQLTNVETFITGSVRQLCVSAASVARDLGYEPIILTHSLNCEAREAGTFLAAIARDHQSTSKSLAFLAGGETIVHLTGHGKGGRNQEIALAAAAGITSCTHTCIFSFGSDGTDGPTNAAGGIVDENTASTLQAQGIDIRAVLQNNDAYSALFAASSLIVTGPTGTNVNDLSVILIKR